jgi:hypothetical protein
MPLKTTRFDRATLYAEVWTNPVIHVAKKYEISDVGLRKVCRRLGVPLPPLGYWARKASGQSPETASLPKWNGPTTYESSRRVDESTVLETADIEEAAEVVKQRAFEGNPKNGIVVKNDLLGCHRWVTETNRLAKKSRSIYRGLLQIWGGHHLSTDVSPNEINRALRIWSALLKGVEARGFEVALTKRLDTLQSPQDVTISVYGELMYLSLTERVRQNERELTPEEIKAQREKPGASIGERYTYTPTGILKLTVKSEFRGYTIATLVDKDNRPIDSQLNDLMITLVQSALARKAARRAREAERRQQAERDLEERRLRDIREKCLTVMHNIESLALRWERAQRLRRFADALEQGVGAADPKTASDQADDQVKWIRRGADWLDPLIRADWPEVDVVGPGYYCHQDWMKNYTELESKGIDDLLRFSDQSEDD